MDSTVGNWIDRAIGTVAPRAALKRVRARMATSLALRHYEGASNGRRTSGWNRQSSDPNLATAPFVARLRDVARDLVRNNPYAESALSTIADHTVGWGIVAKATPTSKRVQDMWNAWAGTTACDAEGRCDLAGLQKLVIRTVAEAGEVLVRRRWRQPTDGLPIPMQLQVLEPDYLDTLKHGIPLPNGGRIVYGVEYDPIGRRVAYWLFPEHPGASGVSSGSAFITAGMVSQRVPADGVLHIFKPTRPGSTRGASWFAPVLLRFKDFDEYEDATLMKQKIAACLAIVTSDPDASGAGLGMVDDGKSPGIDSLEPGMVLNVPPGRDVDVVQPPSVRDYADYTGVTLRAIATGLGVTYEHLSGNYTDLPFSAFKGSLLQHWGRVEDWRWRLMVPQFCDPVWAWAMQAGQIIGVVPASAPVARWSAPPMPVLDPDKEGLAIQRNVRTGIQTLSDAIRERGYDPEEFFAEMAADYKMLDKLKLQLDSDPRCMTQFGQLQGPAAAAAKASTQPATAPPAAGGDAARFFVEWLGRQGEDRVLEAMQRMFGQRGDEE